MLQVLLAVYFFLAGIAVSQRQWLWVMPLASALYGVLFAVTRIAVGTVCRKYSGFTRYFVYNSRVLITTIDSLYEHASKTRIFTSCHAYIKPHTLTSVLTTQLTCTKYSAVGPRNLVLIS